MSLKRRRRWLALGIAVVLTLVHGSTTGSPQPSLDQHLRPRATSAGAVAALVFETNSKVPFVAQFCAGAAITDRIVLTAAHCVEGHPPGHLSVVLGQVDLCETTQPPAEHIRIEEIYVHPSYVSPSRGFDLALLLLEVRTTAPTTSPSSKPEPAGAQVVISGWGRQGSQGPFPCRLTSFRTTVLDRASCAREVGISEEALPSDALCTRGGQQTCVGDSGGPVVSGDPGDPGRQHVVGIVSWGRSCSAESPGINSSVAASIDWICHVLGDLGESPESACPK